MRKLQPPYQESTIFKSGFESKNFRKPKKRYDNPYNQGTLEWEEWDRGWLSSEMQVYLPKDSKAYKKAVKKFDVDR